MTRRFAGVHFIFIPDRRRIQNSLISVATAYQPGINAQKCSKTLNSKHKKRPVSLKTDRFGPSVEIRYILIPEGIQNQCVAAVQPLASNCPPDSCIELFESLMRK